MHPSSEPTDQRTGPDGSFVPPPAGSYGQTVRGPPPASGEAIGALVCGLMAWSCFPLGLAAIWLGVKARRLAREQPDEMGGDNLALAGMWVGGALALIQVLFWILYVGFFATMFGIGAAGP